MDWAFWGLALIVGLQTFWLLGVSVHIHELGHAVFEEWDGCDDPDCEEAKGWEEP